MRKYIASFNCIVSVVSLCWTVGVLGSDSINQRYGHLKQLKTDRPGVALFNPAVNPFSYDAIHVSDVIIQFDDAVEPLSAKQLAKINNGIVKWQMKDLKKAGVPLSNIGSECTLNMLIRVEQLQYDEEKLKGSEKFRFRAYGTALISSELRDATEQKVLAAWLRRVPLGTEQKDRGTADKKIAKSLTRTVVDAIADATDNILPEFQKLVEGVESRKGCQSGIAAGLNAP